MQGLLLVQKLSSSGAAAIHPASAAPPSAAASMRPTQPKPLSPPRSTCGISSSTLADRSDSRRLLIWPPVLAATSSPHAAPSCAPAAGAPGGRAAGCGKAALGRSRGGEVEQTTEQAKRAAGGTNAPLPGSPPPAWCRPPGRAQWAMARWYSGRSGSILMSLAVRTCSRRRRGSWGQGAAAGAVANSNCGSCRQWRQFWVGRGGQEGTGRLQQGSSAGQPVCRPHLPALHLAQAGHHGQVEGDE